MKHYWLVKSEPDEYSIDDLAKDGCSAWTGVRNYQARNFMRDLMQKGDEVLYYHSSTTPPGVIGLAKVESEAYADPTAFDPKSEEFDPKSSPENPTWIVRDICFVEKFSRLITLDEIKTDPHLEGIGVARKGNRLSIQPVLEEHFAYICKLARTEPIVL